MGLWVSHGGRVTCAEHGGMYLTAELEQRPDASEIITPLDHWLLIDAAELPVGCETCEPWL